MKRIRLKGVGASLSNHIFIFILLLNASLCAISEMPSVFLTPKFKSRLRKAQALIVAVHTTHPDASLDEKTELIARHFTPKDAAPGFSSRLMADLLDVTAIAYETHTPGDVSLARYVIDYQAFSLAQDPAVEIK